MQTDTTKYPVGIQDFAEIRTGGYAYIDKTAMIYELLTGGKYLFLARPRRFGKSLLLSTIRYFYEGRRDLFRGLAIDALADDWQPRPVLHISLNTGQYELDDGLDKTLDWVLGRLEQSYGCDPRQFDFAQRMGNLIIHAHQLTGRKVVVLVDEYDKPLISTLGNERVNNRNRSILKGIYSNLKTLDEHIHFAMLTGVTRFSKVSIFSDLNNLRDITMIDRYATICGITEPELTANLEPGIQSLADGLQTSYGQALETLRKHYDGYHFSAKCPGLYNPFSLLSALANRQIEDYWYSTGTATFLARRVKSDDWRLPELQRAMTQPADLADIDAVGDPLPLLFQTGYLTIKSQDPATRCYLLGYPNSEVRNGFINSLFGVYVREGLRSDFSVARFASDIRTGDVDGFMGRLAAMLANIPAQHRPRKYEYEFQNLIYVVFMMLGQMVMTEVNMTAGRADMVVHTDHTIYIFEFKFDRDAETALSQIRDKGYAHPYAASGSEVIAIGANYSPEDSHLTWIAKRL